MNTTKQSATGPLVTQDLRPFNTYESPSRVARLLIVPASEPLWGSVSEYAPTASPEATGVTNFFFCSSVPNFIMPWQYNELFTDIITPCEASALQISSSAST